METTINPSNLFSIKARTKTEQNGQTYGVTVYFYNNRDTMPVQNGKAMKPKAIFGTKARAKVAKEGYAHYCAIEYFSFEEVAKFLEDPSTNNSNGEEIHSYEVIEIELPLPLEGDIAMFEKVNLGDAPYSWGATSDGGKYKALIVRDDHAEIDIETDSIPF